MRDLYIFTEGTTEPITIDQVKTYCEYLGSDVSIQQTLDNIAKAARLRLEVFCGRNFVEKTMVLNVNTVKVRMELPYPPINAITTITPYDNTGSAGTALVSGTDYYLIGAFHKYIRFSSFTSSAEYFEIKYTSGYKSGGKVLPEAIKRAILAQTKYDFRHMSGGGSSGDIMLSNEAQMLLAPYREYEI